MAWPTEAGSIAGVVGRRKPAGGRVHSARPRSGLVLPPPLAVLRRRSRSRVVAASVMPPRRRVSIRGGYRVFNAAEYRFYRSSVGPPVETDTPFATSASLPEEPTDTFADGAWWLSVSYFNGVLDSGFLPLGPAGEKFVRMDIDSAEPGGIGATPPAGPGGWDLQLRPNGVVRVTGFYFQSGADRADAWALTYTDDGSDPLEPPAVTPDATAAIAAGGIAILSYDLPAAPDGATVKVRLQTRRAVDASHAYSEGSVIKSLVADAAGPDAPQAAEPWPGGLPEGI